jgi:calcium uniporter protein, mitochondrial
MATLSRTLAQRFARIIRSASTITTTTTTTSLQPDHHPFLPSGTQFSDRINSLNQTRIRLDCLSPPPAKPETDDDKKGIKITVAEARKVLRASQIEAARAKLKALPSASVPYTEFVAICNNEAAGGAETGSQIAQSLEQSGSVIILGDTVFLRPELVR